MKKVAVLGTGGVGKSTLTTVLAIAICYKARESGRLITAVDADVSEGMLTKMLLGETDGLTTLNDVALGERPEKAVYEPSLAIKDAKTRKKLPGVNQLRVIPASQKWLPELKSIATRSLMQGLYELEDHLEAIGSGISLVDLPPGDPSLSNLTTALAHWVDALIAVVTPSRRRIAATAYACQALAEEARTLAMGVVMNKYDESQPFDEYGNRWEDVVTEYFETIPFVVPKDDQLMRVMTMDAIPLGDLMSFRSVRAMVRGYGVGIKRPLVEELWKMIASLEPKQRNAGEAAAHRIPPMDVAAVEKELEGFFSGEARIPGDVKPSRPFGSPRFPQEGWPAMRKGPRDVLAEFQRRIERPSILSRLRRIGRVGIIYPDGREVTLSRKKLREALSIVELDDRAGQAVSGDEVNLEMVPEDEREAWNIALVYLGLESPFGG